MNQAFLILILLLAIIVLPLHTILLAVLIALIVKALI